MGEDVIVDGHGEVKPEGEILNVRTIPYEELQKMQEQPVEEKPQEKESAVEEIKEPETEKPVEKDQEEKTTTEPEKKVTPEEEALPDYKAKIEELQKIIEAKEKFIARQGTEIGLLRKSNPSQVREQISQLEAEYERIYTEQGKFAADQFWDSIKEQNKRIVEEAQAIQNMERIKGTRDRIVTELPSFETAVSDMVGVLKDDGFNDTVIEQFKQNPYIVEHGELRLLHKAATYRKENISLKTENETLKAKIAELERKPDELLEKINTATKSVNGKSTGTAPPKETIDLTSLNPRRMSYEELKKLGG